MLGIEPECPSAPLGVRDGRIDQDLGREPGFNGWEDWPRSKVRITAMLVGVYCINPLTFEPGFKGSMDRPRFGGEPGFNGWEDWPGSKVSITAMLVGVYCINPLHILNKY